MAWSISGSRVFKASGERRCIVVYRFYSCIFTNYVASDLWELPQSRLTMTVTDDVESHFYLRCPPEKRPRYMGDSSQADAEMEQYSDKMKLEQSFSEEMLTASSTHPSVRRESEPSKSEEGLTPGMWFGREKKGGQPKYDESLFKAIHNTFFTRIWMAGVLKLASGEIPFVFYVSVS